MKLLVTGREGQLARSLAEVATGHELVFAGRPDFDLLDPAGMERVIAHVRPDVIINAAAYTAVDAAEDDPDIAMAANGVAPGVIAAAAGRCGARIVQISTDYVFDGTLDRPYCEDDPTNPLGVYGRTKLAGEQAVAATGAPGAILRTAWVYGPFGRNFVKTMLQLAETRDEVAVVADQRGSPTSSLDLAEAVVRLIGAWGEHADPGLALYHATGAGETNWADFARAVFAARGCVVGGQVGVRSVASSDYPTVAMRPANSTMTNERLSTTLGWTLPPWTERLSSVVRRILVPSR